MAGVGRAMGRRSRAGRERERDREGRRAAQRDRWTLKIRDTSDWSVR